MGHRPPCATETGVNHRTWWAVVAGQGLTICISVVFILLTICITAVFILLTICITVVFILLTICITVCFHFANYLYHCCFHFQKYSSNICSKSLACGHLCGGIRDESPCLPCLHGCSTDTALKQDAEDMCMICFTEALSCAPALQVIIYHCVCWDAAALLLMLQAQHWNRMLKICVWSVSLRHCHVHQHSR